jgi:Rps23 Pro-64 3,4-dihydroxylase Tpa1-like proline 4-hydroxylase
VRFKKWVALFKASINKVLYETGHQFEVASIEEQFLHYDEGGKFEAHLDTQCNPLTSCVIGQDHHYPRLLTWLVFLNPGWTEADGGLYQTYYNWPKLDLREVVTPTLGKGVIIRADKVYHSGEWVNTVKRGITLFVNVKPITQELPLE